MRLVLPTGPRRSNELLWGVVSVAVLLVCLFYGRLYLSLSILGAQWDPATWEVLDGHDSCDGRSDCLMRGDRLLTINGVSLESYRANLWTSKIDWTSDLETRVLRDGREIELRFGRDDFSLSDILSAFLATAFPFLFWLMGTITVVLVRPRDVRWLVLLLFYYTTAIWFAAGFVSASRMGYSAVVLHVLVWLFCPLIIHLHLLLPTPLGRPNKILPPFYLLAAALAALDLAGVIDNRLYLQGALLGLLGSLTILVYRLLVPPREPSARVANRLMLFGVGIGVGPWIAMILLLTWLPLEQAPFNLNNILIAAAALLCVPNWPLAYIFAIYKHEIGNIQLRANRLLGVYSFLSLFVISFVAVFYFVGTTFPIANEYPITVALFVAGFFVAVAPPLRQLFQKLIDRRIFGIRYRRSEVVTLFAERIPSTFDRPRLRRMLVSEILTTLMVRQSALYLIDGDSVEPLYIQKVAPDAQPREASDLDQLLTLGDQFLRSERIDDPNLRWVRLAIPLLIQDQPIGIWLLGRRDPDDFYPRTDVTLFRNLANQIATVLRAQLEIAENKHLHQQLVHAQKMEAIGRLSAGVAHDFNNLLSAILGYGDLLLGHHGDDTATRKYVNGIIDAGEKAEALTRQLLSLSRRRRSEVKVVDVNTIIQGLEILLRRLLHEDIELVFDLRSASYIQIDPRLLEQTLLNLVVNAGDAMPGGGTLRIESADIERASGSPFQHPQVKPGRFVRLRVTDTGVGIDPGIQGRIFEPFFTTKETGKGTGLGLAMVHGLVTDRGGHIFADSAEGEGTTFHIYLPIAAEDQSARQAKVPRRTVAPPGSETVMVVEDEETVRTVVCEVLRAKGYKVLSARDGREALSLSERSGERIDLLLTDVIMPHMRGPELAERLVAKRPEIRVLFMSGYNDEETLGHELHTSESPLIQKPFLPEALALRVREALDLEREQKKTS